MRPNMDMVDRLILFVTERQRIYLKRKEGQPAPWTTDPILQQYKFCNVYREQDKVTRWIHQNIRVPYRDDENLWFMLCLARQINWPDTLSELILSGSPIWPKGDRWDWELGRQVLRERAKAGHKVYTGAYMISGQGKHGRDKPTITFQQTMRPLWRDRQLFRQGLAPGGRATLASVHEALTQYPGFGGFLAAQVVADLKHTRYLRKATDWWDWAVLGPGSTRGLNRLFPQRRRSQRATPLKTPWDHDEAHVALLEIRDHLSDILRHLSLGPRLCLQDTQNCLCEFDKYERTRLGQGRPRATYDGVG